MPDSELSGEEQELLSQVPDQDPVGNIKLRKLLGWDTERYFRVRNGLVEGGILSKGGGRGGSVSRKNGGAQLRSAARQRPSSKSTLSGDETRLFNLVPEDGSTIGNTSLRRRLNWDEDRYLEVRNRLVDNRMLAVGRGRGGSVYRVASIAAPKTTDIPAVRRYRREEDLYVPVAQALRDGWSKTLPHQNFLVDVTGKQGKRATGGVWTRPDVTVVAVTTYAYVPEKSMEVITYEIKPAGNWGASVTGAFEAASHSRFATQSYLLIHAPEGAESVPQELQERLQKECARFGIGLGFFQEPGVYETYDFQIDPERKQPDPGDMNRFIAQQLSETSKQRILTWR